MEHLDVQVKGVRWPVNNVTVWTSFAEVYEDLQFEDETPYAFLEPQLGRTDGQI